MVDGVIPDYGTLGFFIGYAKVGKSTTGIALAGAVSRGEVFLGRVVSKKRALYLAIEDPREYIGWMMARTLRGDEDAVVYTEPLVLDTETLAALEDFIQRENIGFVYVAAFLAGVRGLVEDENDNPGMSAVVGSLKQFARRIGKQVLSWGSRREGRRFGRGSRERAQVRISGSDGGRLSPRSDARGVGLH